MPEGTPDQMLAKSEALYRYAYSLPDGVSTEAKAEADLLRSRALFPERHASAAIQRDKLDHLMLDARKLIVEAEEIAYAGGMRSTVGMNLVRAHIELNNAMAARRG